MRGTGSDIACLARAFKAPRIQEAPTHLAQQARDTGWTHEEHLAAVLSVEIPSREASGTATRLGFAGFGTVKSIEGFNFD